VADVIGLRAGQGEDIVLIGVEGSPSMGVRITSSDPSRGGRPEWPEGVGEHTAGEGVFVEELRLELERRGLAYPRVAGETHALAGHDEETQREQLEAVLDNSP
jgi:predicted secreted protein